jgi:hypothetical protein
VFINRISLERGTATLEVLPPVILQTVSAGRSSSLKAWDGQQVSLLGGFGRLVMPLSARVVLAEIGTDMTRWAMDLSGDVCNSVTCLGSSNLTCSAAQRLTPIDGCACAVRWNLGPRRGLARGHVRWCLAMNWTVVIMGASAGIRGRLVPVARGAAIFSALVGVTGVHLSRLKA